MYSSNEDIIQLIKDGGHDDIGAEKLRGLLKILPEVDELEMLKGFDGDKSKLGNAEKFFLQLIQVPKYVFKHLLFSSMLHLYISVTRYIHAYLYCADNAYAHEQVSYNILYSSTA